MMFLVVILVLFRDLGHLLVGKQSQTKRATFSDNVTWIVNVSAISIGARVLA